MLHLFASFMWLVSDMPRGMKADKGWNNSAIITCLYLLWLNNSAFFFCKLKSLSFFRQIKVSFIQSNSPFEETSRTGLPPTLLQARIWIGWLQYPCVPLPNKFLQRVKRTVWLCRPRLQYNTYMIVSVYRITNSKHQNDCTEPEWHTTGKEKLWSSQGGTIYKGNRVKY